MTALGLSSPHPTPVSLAPSPHLLSASEQLAGHPDPPGPQPSRPTTTTTHMDYKYSLLGPPAEDYRKRPMLLQVDDSSMSLFAELEVAGEPSRRWSTLGFFRKIMLVFLFGLAIMFLIMASYILTGDKKGLYLTPSPYADIKLVMQSLTSKDFTSRQLPDMKALAHNEPHMFSVIPRKFLPGVKNPCWYEEHNITTDPYKTNRYNLYSRRFRGLYENLRDTFREHMQQSEGKYYRVRCLPYFYVIGQPKCGTTDLFFRLRLHPDVRFTTFKEPHWWTRKRFGLVKLSDGYNDRYPVEDYLDLFDLAAYEIQDNLLQNSSGAPTNSSDYKPPRNIIVGEASASTMWDNNAWFYVNDNTTEASGSEPPILIQDFVHALQPDARFIVMLRDPVERLYSDYLYFAMSNKSAEDFHERVSDSLQLFEGCLTENRLRSCVYNGTLNYNMPVRLNVGLYIVYLLDWLTVFSRDQILVLRLEDHASNRKYTMHKVFDFLNLGPLTEHMEAKITGNPASNTRRPADKSLGPMLPVTKKLLQGFYTPFNEELAKVLHNDSFLWESHSKLM